jgi:hypothetical protein
VMLEAMQQLVANKAEAERLRKPQSKQNVRKRSFRRSMTPSSPQHEVDRDDGMITGLIWVLFGETGH